MLIVQSSRPPSTLPLLGNGLTFLQPRHILLDWFTHCSQQSKLSTYEISVPGLPPGIVVNDAKNVEHILRNDHVFIKGEFVKSRSWDLFGNGIINADGNLWKIQRKAGLRFFSNANLKVFVEQIFPHYLRETVERRLDAAATSSELVDLQEVFLELTTALMGVMAYDMDINPSLPFSRAFDLASEAMAERFQNPLWKIKEFFWGSPLRLAISQVKDFGLQIVSHAAKERARRKGDGSLTAEERTRTGTSGTLNSTVFPPEENLINALLDHIEDHQVVADAAMNYLSAGRDTTAQSLTWTFYLLMRHPSTIARIRAELGSQLPPNCSQLPLDSLLPLSLPFTNAVFNESLRLYPPVPIEIKECAAPTIFPDGTSVPKGAVVMWIPWAMGRSRHIWGADADNFVPDRWLDPHAPDAFKPTFISKSAFDFPVFNGGPRACLGKKMAEALAVAVIASLLPQFDFDLDRLDAADPRRCRNALTLPMLAGLPCHVRRRKDVS